MVCLRRPYHFKLFKGCLPQILLGLFLNTLPHLYEDEYIARFSYALTYHRMVDSHVILYSLKVQFHVCYLLLFQIFLVLQNLLMGRWGIMLNFVHIFPINCCLLLLLLVIFFPSLFCCLQFEL